jgi:hypothetical protein
MKTEPQYIEGPEALATFKRAMLTAFRAPKANIRKPKQKPGATARKTKPRH